ncbi:DUF1990 domain-containing protein [Luteipulveratus sp. YIM 133132]|uniref:DUF1990 family protein n=1 Tax=Luteipulveratus flavus TaxID=3031728 RepID=UPI0023AFF8F8|nr:DUF1990 domain-containing protein [Luteipulveratus sp. YIM 133132]MDE9365497.1 DUF1990 domain-containing protein [Luteipulveratus sp. YIM 133132]
MARLLSADDAERLRSLPLTYEPSADEVPDLPGRHTFRRTCQLRSDDLSAAADALMAWRVHEAAGLGVEASTPAVAKDTVIRLTLGVRPLLVRAPCRVVRVIEDVGRVGFAYGTLDGHPESGEELFLLERTPEGVSFTVAASSRPATMLARAGGPLTTGLQRLVTARYLRALDRIMTQ